MTPRGGDDDSLGGRSPPGPPLFRLGERLPVDRRAVLSVWLTLVMVLSLLAVPAAGSALVGSVQPLGPGPGHATAQADDPGGGNGGSGAGGGNGNGGGSDAAGGGDDGDSDGGDGDRTNGKSPSRDGTNEEGSDSSGNGNSNAAGSESSDDRDSSGGAAGQSGSGDSDGGGSGSSGSDGSKSGNSGSPGSSGSNAGDSGSSPNDDRGADRSSSNGDSGAEPGRSGSNGGGGSSGGPPDGTPPGQDGDGGPPDRADRGNSGAAGEPERPDGPNGPPRDGGPSVRVTQGQSGDSGGGAPSDGPPGRPDGVPPTSVVEVAVSDARAGDDVSVDVSPATAGPVGFDEVSLTVRRGGDFTMRVTNSPEPLAGSPAFDPEDDAESLGRVRLDHSIANDEVEAVSFVVRVEKARLRATGTDPEDVALYRFAGDEWTALPTEVVGETGTGYLLRVDSPGLSEFAVGAKRASFETFWARASASTVAPGEQVRISGRAANVGGADGVHEATLVVDGEVVEVRQVTVAAGGTRQVNFHRTFDRPGTYEVSVDGVPVGEVVVEEPDGPPEPSLVSRALSLALEGVLDAGRALGTPWNARTATR